MRNLIARRRVARTFERLTHGEWEAIVAEMAEAGIAEAAEPPILS